MRWMRILTSLGLGVLLVVPVPAATAQDQPVDDVSVASALVNKLGGVSVIGTMTCAATAQAIRDGQMQLENYATGQWETVAWTEGDKLVMLTNPDQYVVSQPSGKKTTIRAVHESSRAHPCYTDAAAFPDGTPITCDVGAACAWVTDAFGWDHEQESPYFDYAPNGRFKTGLLNVTGHASGLYVTVLHQGGGTSDYGSPDAFWMPYNRNVRAVLYR